MNFLSNPVVARLLWLMPLLLVVISVALGRAGLEQRQITASGQSVVAEIVEIETRQRSEISRGHVRLRYELPGEAMVDRTVELPMTFLKELEVAPQQQTVAIRVLPDRDQIVIERHMRGQWIMTLSFAGMSLFGALGLAWMVASWNRYLRRHGDPAGGGTPAVA